MKSFGLCQRCGMWAVEHLRTHSYCWECNFSPQIGSQSKIRHQVNKEHLSGVNYQENEFDLDEELLKDLASRESIK